MKKSEEDQIRDLQYRYSQLKTERAKFEPRWTEAQEYVDTVVLSWDDLGTIPSQPNRYSSIPCNYLNIMTNGLVGYSISPNIVWFKLSIADHKLYNAYGVRKWLEQVEDIMLSKFNASNLYQQAAKVVKEGGVTGTGVLLIDEDIKNNRLRFTKMPTNEIYLDINEYGEVDTCFRRYFMTVRNTVEYFGIENVHENIADAYKDVNKWNEKVEIIQAVLPREQFNPEMKNAENMPFACFYIDLRNQKIIKESGYETFPYAVFSWNRYDGFAYSSSPAIDALPDIKGLNIAKKTSWQIAQTSAEPPMKVSEDIRKVNITPRGFTYVTSADQIIEPIRTGENYPITLEVLNEMKQDIKDWFNVDFFLMLQQKQGKMTATEVMELQGEKAATLANLIVNLNEALLKIIQRSFSILMRAGELPTPPQALLQYGADIKIDFMGPLAQAQKKYHTMGGIAQATQLAANIMQIFPNTGDYIDADQLMKNALEGQGMPQSVVREDEDVKKLREARVQAEQQAAAQQQQMAMAQALMQNANKMGTAPQEGSLMSELNSQLAGGLPR